MGSQFIELILFQSNSPIIHMPLEKELFLSARIRIRVITMDAMRFPALYSDVHGTISSEIISDGQQLTIELDGIRFTGHSFDDLSPIRAKKMPILPPRFNFHQNRLAACKIHCSIPMRLVLSENSFPIQLQLRIYLGTAAPHGGLDHESIIAKFLCPKDDSTLITRFYGTIDNVITDLLHQMSRKYKEVSQEESFPPFLKCCYCCAYSDYFPGGWGLFGELFCFRNCKAQYLAVKSKDDLFAIWDQNSGSTQEIWLCDEFEPRQPNTGYRG
jgi:hypothetical protein